MCSRIRSSSPAIRSPTIKICKINSLTCKMRFVGRARRRRRRPSLDSLLFRSCVFVHFKRFIGGRRSRPITPDSITKRAKTRACHRRLRRIRTNIISVPRRVFTQPIPSRTRPILCIDRRRLSPIPQRICKHPIRRRRRIDPRRNRPRDWPCSRSSIDQRPIAVLFFTSL